MMLFSTLLAIYCHFIFFKGRLFKGVSSYEVTYTLYKRGVNDAPFIKVAILIFIFTDYVQVTVLFPGLKVQVPVYAPVPVIEQLVILPVASKLQVKLPPAGTQDVLTAQLTLPAAKILAYSAAAKDTQFLTSDIQVDLAAVSLYLANWGMAIAAKMAMIATTINNSTRVKPLSSFACIL